MARVRVATCPSADTPYLLRELQRFEAEFGSPLAYLPSPDVARAKLDRLIEHHVVYIAEDDAGNPVGFICGFVGPHPFNPDLWQLTELLWWVSPEARHGRAGHGRALLEAFIRWGRENCDVVVLAISRNTPVSPRSLERRGFFEQERSYVLAVTPGRYQGDGAVYTASDVMLAQRVWGRVRVADRKGVL